MNQRSADLLRVRPEIPNIRISPQMSPAEHFQNVSLRPVIKLQNELLVASFRNYINKHKGAFHALGMERQMDYIENAIQKDIKFRNALKGIIIGQFTIEEYEMYISNSSALNKRMMQMVIERLKDQLQLFCLEEFADN